MLELSEEDQAVFGFRVRLDQLEQLRVTVLVSLETVHKNLTALLLEDQIVQHRFVVTPLPYGQNGDRSVWAEAQVYAPCTRRIYRTGSRASYFRGDCGNASMGESGGVPGSHYLVSPPRAAPRLAVAASGKAHASQEVNTWLCSSFSLC